jgi:glycosyltransferase involved in cell wall biosynthesis
MQHNEVKLRILFLGVTWPPVTFIARLIKGLADAGDEVTIASPEKLGKAWHSIPGVHWLPTPAWGGFFPFRLLMLLLRFCCAFFVSPSDLRLFSSHIQTIHSWRKRNFKWNLFLPFVGRRWDVIYFPWNFSAVSYLPLFDLGCPVVVSCRGSQINIAPHNPRRRFFVEGLNKTFRRAAAVHCVCENIKEQAIHLGLNPEKATVIRPAIDTNFFCPSKTEISNATFRVVTTGSLIWLKGYEYALLAMRSLVDSGVPVYFEIMGGGPEATRVLYTIHDLALQDHVLLLGRLRPEEIQLRLQQADVFLLSSLSEGISNAVLEAMACGKPVITTDCGGMREAVEDGVEGFVVSIRDPEGMAKALQTLWQEPKLRRQMGISARKRVIREFNLENQIKQFRALYHSVTELSSPPPKPTS